MNQKRHASQQSLNSAVKTICDVMRRSNCAGAMKYVPELTWILFLRILDEREAQEAEEADALGIPFVPSLQAPFRWRDWAAPESAMRQDKNAKSWDFVHGQLLKAQEIEDAVFDLKAVNPNRVPTQDTRTPAELLDFIADKGKEADTALGCLRELVGNARAN